MNCSNCQNPIAEGEKFCGKCGNQLNVNPAGNIQFSGQNNFSGKKIAVIITAVVFLILFLVVLFWFGNIKQAEKIKLSIKSVDPIAAGMLYGIATSGNSKSSSGVSKGSGDTALMRAAQNGNSEEVKKLLAQGVDINEQNKYGYTALASAIIDDREQIVELLLKAGAKMDVGGGYEEGTTPLMFAVMRNATKSIKLLISYGAGVNAKNNNGMTALAYAVQNSIESVEILLKAGADPNIKVYGRTELDRAMVSNSKLVDREKLIILLKQYGAKKGAEL